jgi:hypothetical protein
VFTFFGEKRGRTERQIDRHTFVIRQLRGCGQMTRNGPPAWGMGEEVTTPHNRITVLRNTYCVLRPVGSYKQHAEISGSVIAHRMFLTI